MKSVKSLVVVAVAVAFTAPMAANAIVIDGIGFKSGENVFSPELVATSITQEKDIVSGYGRINTINSMFPILDGEELTFEFGGFAVVNIAADGAFSTTGGWVNFFADSTPDYNREMASTADGSDIDSNLWLSLVANEQVDMSSLEGFVASSLNQGSVVGQFDVNLLNPGSTGGIFDTDLELHFSDFTVELTTNVLSTNIMDDRSGVNTMYTRSGGGQLKTNAIPEPSTLALMLIGLGMIGFTSSLRRKSKSTNK